MGAAYQFDILDCAPANVVLRDVQKRALLWFQENWERLRVFVLNMPVGAGKSIVAMTICEWIKRNGLGKAATITPTKILQDQYNKDFDWIPMLKGMENYECGATPAGNCKSTKRIFEKCCETGCPYLAVRSACMNAPVSLYNFHSYRWNKMWKDFVIIDEGHNAANFLFDMFSVKLWQPEWNYDKGMEENVENVLVIIEAALMTLKENLAMAIAKKAEKLIDELDSEVKRYEGVKMCLKKWGKDVLIVKKEEEYQGKVAKHLKGTKQVVIYIKPLKVSSFAAEVLWPAEKTNKVILMSATINMNDVEELGLTNLPVGYFESESPIPKERRPFVYWPVADMKAALQRESLPKIAEAIKALAARHPNDKGIIHCTYGIAVELQKHLKGARFWFHDKNNKLQKYHDFRTQPGNMVLVASGMAEGIDLPDDAARWQVITKVMYPSLGDDVQSWRAHNAGHLYRWDTVRTIIQQSGRICRNPNDFGITYMIDSGFKKLRDMTPSMWPKWFTEACIEVKNG